MTTFAAIKERGRRALHATMGRPAYYYESANATPVALTVRYHSAVARAGDLAGTNLSYAETHDRAESVIFLWEDVPAPKRNSTILFSPDEGYEIREVWPRDGITVTATVIRASAAKLSGKLSPLGPAP